MREGKDRRACGSSLFGVAALRNERLLLLRFCFLHRSAHLFRIPDLRRKVGTSLCEASSARGNRSYHVPGGTYVRADARSHIFIFDPRNRIFHFVTYWRQTRNYTYVFLCIYTSPCIVQLYFISILASFTCQSFSRFLLAHWIVYYFFQCSATDYFADVNGSYTKEFQLRQWTEGRGTCMFVTRWFRPAVSQTFPAGPHVA